MDDWKFGPPILVGERVLWVKNSVKPTESGVVRWIGKLSKESGDWTVGIELDNTMACGGTDGSLGNRKLFHCHPGKGVFLPLSRIRKEVTKDKLKDTNETPVNWEPPKGRKSQYEDRENTPGSEETDSKMAGRALKEVPKWINNDENDRNPSSDSDELKSDVQSQRKSARIRRKRNKSPRSTLKKDELHLKREIRRPFSITGRLHNNDWQPKHDYQRKHESCALEEKYIREFIQREIHKHQDLGKMNGVKGNFKKIDEDDIHIDTFQYRPPKKFEGRVGKRSDAYLRREKPNGFFSFLKWFKKSKEMPELEGVKNSSVTSSPLFIRRRSSSCGSVDTLFSIATANSFAFVSPVQYQAVISSTHTTYPVPLKSDDETKSKNQSDYENNPSPLKKSEEVKKKENGQCSTERRKKCRAPDPPRDISLPSTLEFKKTNEEDDSDTKNGHRRTVSESFKDKKAGFYCHVQGKRKAPLPPSSVPLYPSLTSLKSQCPSISKKKRPAPSPPDRSKENVKNDKVISNYDNIPYQSKDPQQREFLKPSNANLTPLLGLNNDVSSSPLPTRPWYKRSSSGSNILKKESGEKKKNKENEEWMPEVGFSRRPISNDSGHNLFNLLSRLDKNQDKKKEEKRKSQISILANISELDREAAEIVRKEHAQEKKLMEDKDEMYYSPYHESKILSSFPNIQNTAEILGTSFKATKSPFDEFKPMEEHKGVNKQRITKMEKKEENKREEEKVKYDANAELDYYINPWNCPKCTLENPGWEKFCEACNTMRLKFKAAAEAPKSEAEEPEEAEEEKPKSPNLIKSKNEEVAGTDQEEPSEDNLEGVRRKRLAFFTSKQSSLRGEEDHEKAKLKIMLKEMKNSLPKREKGVINNATGSTGIDPAADTKNAGEKDILKSPITSEVADSKEVSKSKVQQTWQPNASDPSKYGAIKKAKQQDLSSRAEAIIVTKTTIVEDVLVKKSTPKVSTSVQTASTVKNDNHEYHSYANIQNIKGVLDLSTYENTITNGDIEAVTSNVENEPDTHTNYKVDIQAGTHADEKNTLDINRLLRKLEAAINTGQHLEAANIAKELARMKVNCSVKRQKIVPDGLSKLIVDLYIEDKLTHKGPIQIQILPNITLGQLKMRVEREWDIPRSIQRWILGKQLATDDSKTLEEHGVVNNSCPLFLYIVTSENPGLQAEGSEVLQNVEGSHTRSGRVAMYAEARRPSLIIEEDSESGCEGTEENLAKKEEMPQEGKKCPEMPKTSATGAKKREMFERRDSQSSLSFEKTEMNEHLKKELKMISVNSVKDRIEKLNRAAIGATQDEQRGKGDTRTESNKQKWHYNELMQLENTDLVPNVAEFECPICLVGYAPGEGVVLKDCLHIFCRSCLVNTIQYNEEAEVKCPYRDNNYSCESVLQQREIKSLVPKGLFEQHLAKSVSVAENNIGNTYHCKTPDCKGWCILEDNVNEFRCPVCRKTNCLTCQAIHSGLDCRQYQEQLEFASDTNVEAKKTRDMLQEMVEKGEAMACPTCQVVLMKKWGCDWLRCSMCKTEICWVTRGPRWGPGGKGDTSSGCQCGVNGVKCHPKCNYCH